MRPEADRNGRPLIGWLDRDTATCRTKRIRKRAGRCYELAMRGCMQAPEWELVHGECDVRSGGQIGHAWLEFDGEAYCPVLDDTMPVSVFLRVQGARTHARYSSEDAAILMLRSGHYGPWSDLPPHE